MQENRVMPDRVHHVQTLLNSENTNGFFAHNDSCIYFNAAIYIQIHASVTFEGNKFNFNYRAAHSGSRV